MFRRSLIAWAAALVFVAPATATIGHIRIEGRTRTIFGAADPRVSASTALDALESASRSGEFYVHVSDTSYGPYVDQVGLYAAFGSSGWTYKVNGVSPPVGADQYVLKPGNRVLWYWAFFGLKGGPATLRLARLGHGCYRVVSQDDQGKESRAAGSVLHVDGRSVRTRAAEACVGRHHGLVRATLTGAVRSNALP